MDFDVLVKVPRPFVTPGTPPREALVLTSCQAHTLVLPKRTFKCKCFVTGVANMLMGGVGIAMSSLCTWLLERMLTNTACQWDIFMYCSMVNVPLFYHWKGLPTGFEITFKPVLWFMSLDPMNFYTESC